MMNTQLRDGLVKWACQNMATNQLKELEKLAKNAGATVIPLAIVTAEVRVDKTKQHGKHILRRKVDTDRQGKPVYGHAFSCYPIAKYKAGSSTVVTMHCSEWR